MFAYAKITYANDVESTRSKVRSHAFGSASVSWLTVFTQFVLIIYMYAFESCPLTQADLPWLTISCVSSGKDVKVMRRAKVSVQKGDVCKVLRYARRIGRNYSEADMHYVFDHEGYFR